ncbi:MAG TPA: hypothetical protein VGE42_09035, partial [Candidatus Dormibacteraeota bacterium]
MTPQVEDERLAGGAVGAGPAGWSNRLERLLGWADRDLGLAALGLALLPAFLLMAPPSLWDPNEEDYLALAFRKVAPAAFPAYSAVFDQANARFLSNLVLGLPVAWLGYEPAHLLLRVAGAVLYALAFAALLRSLRLGLLDGLAALALFGLLGPDLMGGEWLFFDAEPKTFAYAFVFLAIAAGVRDRWLWAAVSVAVATYFHFLVGGFWAAWLCVFHLALHRRWRSSVTLGGLYALATAPLLAVVVLDQVRGAAPVPPGGPSADYIYTILRNPHHLAPFSVPGKLHRWVSGAVATAALMAGATWVALRRRGLLRALAAMVAGCCAWLLLALAASWPDRATGALGKLYLFRPSSLTLLLACLAAAMLAREALPRGTANLVRRLVALGAVALFAWHAAHADAKAGREQRLSPAMRDAVAAVRRITAPGDVVMVEPVDDFRFPYVRMERLLDRPTLVSWKFVPTNAAEIYRWWDLWRLRLRLFDAGCAGGTAGIPIRYLLV